jgi:hypothetical protein
LENAVVLLIVTAAAVYAAWQLAPQALRRRVLGEASAASGGCASCKGCAAAAGESPKKGTIRVIS